MDGSKEVTFRNYDDATGFFFDDTVEAFVWDNDLVMCSGYWVVDKTLTIGMQTGSDEDKRSHQIVISGDVKLIVEDGVSLTMRWDDSFKMDADAMIESITGTVDGVCDIVTGVFSESGSDIAEGISSTLDSIGSFAEKMIDDNQGTNVAMISVCKGAYFTVYGQEGGTGKLDITGTTASSSSDHGGAAIGSDNDTESGNITINGGVVTAQQADGGATAAIGGGRKGAASGITINGGDVSANANHHGYGAGIGAGFDEAGSDITINGGHVWAASKYGAAIGGGDYSSAQNITINGGYVVADNSVDGAKGGAAIGGGYGASGDSTDGITITNGYVLAKGSNVTAYDSPGIGAGATGGNDVNHISVSGGHLVSMGGNMVIGHGKAAYGDHQYYFFSGVDLYLDGAYQGYQNGSYDWACDDGWDAFDDAKTLESYKDPTSQNPDDWTGDKTSSAGYYSDTVNGGFYEITDGHLLANTQTSSIKGLYNNGDYIYGGAIFANGGSLDLYSVTISNNRSLSNGVQGKGAAIGGAIYAKGSGNTSVNFSTFENNVTTGSTGDFRGGAIASEQDTLTVQNSTFNSNKTTSQGGGVYASGQNVTVSDSVFSSNYASYGGGVYASGTALIKGNTFSENIAGIAGAAVYAAVGSTVTVKSSIFDTNRAHSYNYSLNDTTYEDFGTHCGGAVYVAGDEEQAKGATVDISSSDFSDNYAKQGGALYVAAYGKASVTNANFINSQAAGEGGAIYVEKEGTLTLNDVYFSGSNSTVKDDDGNVLTSYCAIYNEGEVNFTGSVTVDPYWLDKMYNCGWITWDLTGDTANGYFSDMTLFINEIDSSAQVESEKYVGSFGLRVNANDLGGITNYVLGRNANFDDISPEQQDALSRFVLRGVEGQEDRVIKLNGDEIEYNGKWYKLTSSNDPDDYYELNLTVREEAERTGHIVVNQKNFSQGILNSAGDFENYDFGETQGGIVLVESDGIFSVHDSTFTANKAQTGGAIYVKAGGYANLTGVTFNGNISGNGKSGALYIEKDAIATLYGDVTLCTTADTIYNEGSLVWNIGLTSQGYLSDYSRLVNSGSLVIKDALETQYGSYKLAGNADGAEGAEFTVIDSDGNTMTLLVNGAAKVYGDYAWSIYVNREDKDALYLNISATRIVVANGENYMLNACYGINMSGSEPYAGNGQTVEVQAGGTLTNTDSAKFIECSATGNGGAVSNSGSITIANSIFTGNQAANGGAVSNSGNAALTLVNAVFHRNAANGGNGGAIRDDAAGTISLTDAVFKNNTATGNGGAIAITDGTLNLTDVVFSRNTAGTAGGAISVAGSGTINLYGEVTLKSDTDTIDLGTGGKLAFILNTEQSGYLSDYSKITGSSLTNAFSITVNSAKQGRYVLADNAASAAAANQTFTIKMVTSTAGIYSTSTVTVNEESAACEGRYYSLTVNSEDQLILQILERTEVKSQLTIQNDVDVNLTGVSYDGNGGLFDVKATGMLENTGSLNFTGCSVTGNGGVINSEGTVSLDSAGFDGNTAGTAGGAISAMKKLTISDSVFTSNSTSAEGSGGAISFKDGSISLTDTSFTGNTAKNGGAIDVSNAELTLKNVTFDGNTVDGQGGAIYLNGGSTLYLNGDVSLKQNSDTIYLADSASSITWLLGEQTGGCLSDFSLLQTSASAGDYHFTIDALGLAKWLYETTGTVLFEKPELGHSYLLAENADSAVSYGSFVLKYAASQGVYATEDITINKPFYDDDLKIYYSLSLNASSHQLALSLINHIDVNETTCPSDGVYAISRGADYNWAGMDDWSSDGTIFNVGSDGTLENELGATLQNGKTTGSGGAVYNAGKLKLNGTVFSGNTAGVDGGAVYNAKTAVFKAVSFKGNAATGNGGALYNAAGATVSIGTAVFDGNTGNGGAIYNAGTLNITGKITLSTNTNTDTIFNDGADAVINWALNDANAQTRNTDFSISDLSKVTNNGGKYTLTLYTKKDEKDTKTQMSGMFKLAGNAASGMALAVSGMSDQTGAVAMSVDSGTKLDSRSSTDKKTYYELLLDNTNNVFFTVDNALFLNDDWGDNEAGLSATFHGSAISGSAGDGTFFNDASEAGSLALNTNATVIVLGLAHSNVFNFQKRYSLRGTVDLSGNNAWVNAGTRIRNAIVNWDLTGVTDAAKFTVCIKGFENYRNSPTTIDGVEKYLVNQTITVTDTQASGDYVIATGDFSVNPETQKPADTTGKFNFSLVSTYDTAGTALTFDDVIEYNSKYYSLSLGNDGGEDTLILNVDTEAKITIKVDNASYVYDGQNHEASYTVVGENLLQAGHSLQVTLSNTAGLTNVGSIDNITVATYDVVDSTGASVKSQYQFNNCVAGSLKITKRDVTVTSDSATKVYDGTPLTAPGYTVTGKGFVAGQGATYKVTGSQTEIGTSKNTIICSLNDGTDVRNYDINVICGDLSVISDEPITITANSASKSYDGTELSDSGYSFTQGILLSGDTLSVTVEGSITDAGTAYNKVTSYKVMRGKTDVTQNYTFAAPVDGILEVRQRALLISSASDTKPYDGTPLVNHTVTVTGDGFLEGEGATYEVTGSQTVAGTSKNKFTYTLNEGTNAKNYAITQEEGDLTVTGRGTITITADSARKMYDGTALTAGYTFTQGVLIEGDKLFVTVEGSITDAGSAVNHIASYKVMRDGTDVTGSYIFADPVDGVLEVTKRNLTLTSASGSRVYDGTAYSIDAVIVGGDEFAEGEGATYDVNGTQTDAGTSANTYTYSLNENTKAENYVITKAEGSLRVTKRDLTLTSANDIKLYDGTPLVNETIYANSFAEGEGATYDVTGSQTEIGTSKNTFTYTLNENTKAENYNISTEFGTLAVGLIGTITITADSASKVYDGTALTAGYTFTQGVLVEGDELIATVDGSITDVGTAINKVTSYKVMRGDVDVTAGYYFTSSIDGVLEVTKRDLTLTSASDTKFYDGTPLVNGSVHADNFAAGDGATYTVTGSQTEVGSSANIFTYKLNDNTKAGNYNITTVEGTLTVTRDMIVEGTSGSIEEDTEVPAIHVSGGGDLTIADGVSTVTSTVYLTRGQLLNQGTLRTEQLVVNGITNELSGNSVAIGQVVLAENAELTVDKAQYDSLIAYSDIQSAGKLIVTSASGTELTQTDIDKLMAKAGLSYVAFSDDLKKLHNLKFTAAKSLVIHCGNGFGTDKNDTLQFAKNSDVALGTHGNMIDLQGGGNKVQLDANSKVVIHADLANASTVKAASAVTACFADIAFSASRNATLDIGKNANVLAEDLSGTDRKTSIKTGAGSTVSLQNVMLQNESDKIAIGANGKFSAGTLDFGAGSDKLSIGKNSIFNAESIKDADTVDFSASSTAEIKGNIDGTRKLTVGSAALKAAAVTGTAANDSFNFGSWSDVDFASLDFGDGNDTLKIGNYADVDISGLDFGSGDKDKLTIGKGATLSVDTLDVASLDTLSMSKNSFLRIADADDLADAKEKWSKYSSQIVSKLA